MKIKAFLDTNVILDLFLEGRKSTPASNAIFQAVFDGKIEAVITTQSLLDAYYIYCDAQNGEWNLFLNLVNRILNYVNVDAIQTFDLRWAGQHFSGDFEDDAQLSRALDTCCDVYVTNDKKFRARHSVGHEFLQFMSPDEFLARMTPTHS